MRYSKFTNNWIITIFRRLALKVCPWSQESFIKAPGVSMFNLCKFCTGWTLWWRESTYQVNEKRPCYSLYLPIPTSASCSDSETLAIRKSEFSTKPVSCCYDYLGIAILDTISPCTLTLVAYESWQRNILRFFTTSWQFLSHKLRIHLGTFIYFLLIFQLALAAMDILLDCHV